MDRRHFQLCRWRALAMFAAALAFQPAAASAQAPRPEHHWAVDWGGRYCTWRGSRGCGRGTTNFFVRVVGLRVDRVSPLGPARSAFRSRITRASIVFKPSGERFEACHCRQASRGERFRRHQRIGSLAGPAGSSTGSASAGGRKHGVAFRCRKPISRRRLATMPEGRGESVFPPERATLQGYSSRRRRLLSAQHRLPAARLRRARTGQSSCVSPCSRRQRQRMCRREFRRRDLDRTTCETTYASAGVPSDDRPRRPAGRRRGPDDGRARRGLNPRGAASGLFALPPSPADRESNGRMGTYFHYLAASSTGLPLGKDSPSRMGARNCELYHEARAAREVILIPPPRPSTTAASAARSLC